MYPNFTTTKLELRDYAISKKGIRQNKILFLLMQKKSMSNQELCRELGCSEATIRNDLRELDQMKLIQRTFGGASALDDTYGGVTISDHLNYATKEKFAIARYVAENVIKPHQSIILDGGSTCLTLARELSHYKEELSVVTNSLLNADTLAQNPHINLTLPGGVYNMTSDTFDSAGTLAYYQNVYADCYCMSANGLAANGVTLTMTADANRAVIKQRIIQQASSVILLCDHHKINKTCFHKVCDVSQLTLIVTDDNCTDEERASFEKLETPVVFAPVGKP